jgi:hypothetical protein
VLSTRGAGAQLEAKEIDAILKELPQIEGWMRDLLDKAKTYERVQQSH